MSTIHVRRRAGALASVLALSTFTLAAVAPARTAFAQEAAPPQPAPVSPLPPAAAPVGPADLPAPEVQRVRGLHRSLKVATAASLALTGALGIVVAFNRTTSLETGRCETGDPVFGNYGCGPLSTVHGISAVTSIVLYTATATFEFGVAGVPAPEKIAPHAGLHRALTYVHLAGIVLQPLLGILARYPDVIGIDDPGNQADFSKVTRTIHGGIGVATLAAYVTTLALEW